MIALSWLASLTAALQRCFLAELFSKLSGKLQAASPNSELDDTQGELGVRSLFANPTSDLFRTLCSQTIWHQVASDLQKAFIALCGVSSLRSQVREYLEQVMLGLQPRALGVGPCCLQLLPLDKRPVKTAKTG